MLRRKSTRLLSSSMFGIVGAAVLVAGCGNPLVVTPLPKELEGKMKFPTVVVTKDARLLALDGDRFMELILQAPEISFDIFRVITRRLRAAEERLRAQTNAAAATPAPEGSAALR